MQPLRLLLLAHLSATLLMTGVIWFVQVVHYRLFDGVGEADYSRYAARHARLTSFVVGMPMLVELATGALLAYHWPLYSPMIEGREAWAGLALLGLIWVSTAILQVPQHNALGEGWNPRAHRKLLLTNWLRVGAWTLRSALVLVWTARMMR